MGDCTFCGRSISAHPDIHSTTFCLKILLPCFGYTFWAGGKFCNPPGSAVKIRKQCRLTAAERSVKKPLRRVFFVSTVVKRKVFTIFSIYFCFLNSVYTRSGQNSTPNSNATNLHSSQKRCCSFCISSSNASPTFQVQKSIFHQMTKPIQVTVILPLLLAISLSWNDDIHSSISGISNDLIGVIPTIGQ